MTIPVRLLPYLVEDGPYQMAADEVMLEAAANHLASIRFYRWIEPTLSIGYFQKHNYRHQDNHLREYPFVRRATGGGAIIHDNDLTYAIALPHSIRKSHTPANWHCRIHEAITKSLLHFNIPAEMVCGENRLPQNRLNYLCFSDPQPGDVILNGTKIVGGAQRLKKGALLQHGSIQLPDWQPDIQAFANQLATHLHWQLIPNSWTDHELNRIHELKINKYAQDSWNDKR